MPSSEPAPELIMTVTPSHFEDALETHQKQLVRGPITIVQVNIGKRCNQACHHCHVESGPLRTENMEAHTVDRLIELLADAPDVTCVDITGGAPEMNPHFRRFVSAIRAMDKQVIDRCNLTILSEPGHETTAAFLAEQQVTVVASLPCYSAGNVDTQRGNGVFEKSIRALQNLNALGYAQADSPLTLDLVYNPVGQHLPPPQAQLHNDYQQRLLDDFGIRFNALYTLTNMPIKRFAHQLEREGKLAEYMQLLIDNFNPSAVDHLMCRQQISVGYDGQLYDCDFNQMLEIPAGDLPQTLWSINHLDDISRAIAVDDHCYACTAGAGSSCGGTLV